MGTVLGAADTAMNKTRGPVHKIMHGWGLAGPAQSRLIRPRSARREGMQEVGQQALPLIGAGGERWGW